MSTRRYTAEQVLAWMEHLRKSGFGFPDPFIEDTDLGIDAFLARRGDRVVCKWKRKGGAWELGCAGISTFCPPKFCPECALPVEVVK